MQRLVIVVVAFAALAYTYAETNCQTHQKSSRTAGVGGLKWDIQCDEQGNYKPTQCTEVANANERKWCTCYNKDEAITGPSRSRPHCECTVEKHEKEQANKPACEIPQCENNGLYKKTQCCNNECRCVDEKTGKTVTCPPSS